MARAEETNAFREKILRKFLLPNNPTDDFKTFEHNYPSIDGSELDTVRQSTDSEAFKL